MKTVWIAVVVALVVSGSVVAVTGRSRPQGDMGDHPDGGLLAMEARIAELEGREAPILLRGGRAKPRSQELAERLEALERRLATLEHTRPDSAAVPEHTAEGEPVESPRLSDGESERSHRRQVEARRTAIRQLGPKKRMRAFYELAMEERNRGWHEMEESILRELIEDAGPEEALAKESAYQIGWARERRSDHAGARRAWIEACAHYDAEHWRRDYARYNAASSAIKMKQPDLAMRELEDLVRDLESQARDDPRKKTILSRSRTLLASLAN